VSSEQLEPEGFGQK